MLLLSLLPLLLSATAGCHLVAAVVGCCRLRHCGVAAACLQLLAVGCCFHPVVAAALYWSMLMLVNPFNPVEPAGRPPIPVPAMSPVTVCLEPQGCLYSTLNSTLLFCFLGGNSAPA